MELQQLVQCIVGSMLCDVGRAANMLWLSLKKGETEYALDVQGCFRFVREGTIVTAGGDMYLPSSAYEGAYEEFSCNDVGQSLFDEAVKTHLYEHPQCVDVTIGLFNDLEIQFDNGLLLSVFSDTSTNQEQWRLFEKGHRYKEHLVVSPLDFALE